MTVENTRTLAAADAMRAGDIARLGELMAALHASMRDDFEASSAELDTIVGIASAALGCIAARVTGAGFGGCSVRSSSTTTRRRSPGRLRATTSTRSVWRRGCV